MDVRLIAATNQPLERMIEEGRFRQDLFYRLNVVSIEIPPLRERGNDIILLAAHYLKHYNKKYGKQLKISEHAYQAFLRYSWPGNVRELQNVVEGCVVLCSHDVVQLEDLPGQLAQSRPTRAEPAAETGDMKPMMRLSEAVEACERAAILAALKEAGGCRKKTMELLDVPRRTFYRKLQKYHISLD